MNLPFGNAPSFAIYGGTFSPPHQGHLMIAKKALKDLPVSSIIVMPTIHNPLKDIEAPSFEDRVSMCRSLFFDHPMIHVSKFEQDQKMSGFLIDNLRKIREFYPNANIWFIMGADCLVSFDKWKEHEEITQLVNIAVYPRTQESSTLIREYIQNKQYKEAKEMIGPRALWHLMKRKGLYGLGQD